MLVHAGKKQDKRQIKSTDNIQIKYNSQQANDKKYSERKRV